MTWTAVVNSTFGSSSIYKIAYGNGIFVAGGGYGGKMAYSSDNGVTWTAITQSVFTNDISAIAYGNDKFIAGGPDGKMATSPDGKTWTAVADSTFGSSSIILAIAYGNGKFVAGGNAGYTGKIATSSDGTNWTAVADTNTIFGANPIGAIAFANGTFVAGYGSSGREKNGTATSSDGINWTAGAVRIFGDNYNGINAIAYGNGKFVAVGDRGKIATSTDGLNWTLVDIGTLLFGTFDTDKIGIAPISAIAYGNDKFVAGGYIGKMATSSDGTNWTSVEDNTFDKTKAGILAIAYGNGKFVAGGVSGKITYSTGGGTDSGNTGNNNPQTATYTGTASGTAYTLKITENTARYAAQKGDAYELTGGTKKSTGTVNNVSGGVLTLKPSNATSTFTATVSGSSITALNGTITWTDKTTAAAPGTFTSGTDPGTGSGGTVTITDIPAKYNGKYAGFAAQNSGADSTAGGYLIGYQSVSSGTIEAEKGFGNSTLSRISNGRVSIPSWFVNADKTVVRYSGNDTFDSLAIFIYEADTAIKNALADNDVLVVSMFLSVTFSNGSVTRSRNNATVWSENK